MLRKKKKTPETQVSFDVQSSPAETTESEVANTKSAEVEQNVTLEPEPKVFRQGPWIHPFPIITGLSVVALLAVAG